MRFDTKLGHGTCATRHIPCVCTQYTSILDIPWSPGGPPNQQPRYQPVTDCTL